MKLRYRVTRTSAKFLVALILMTAGVLYTLYESSAHSSGSLFIQTSDVDNAQVGIPYSFQMRTNLASTQTNLGSSGGNNWALETGVETIRNRLSWMRINSATGVITGTPSINDAGLNMTFEVGCDSGGAIRDTHTYTITVGGQLTFDFGPANPVDKAVQQGATNVPIAQFSIKAFGEDMQLNTLRLFGIGTGIDTFDIQRVRLYRDVNGNGVVNAGDFEITGSKQYSAVSGFNPAVTFSSIGYIIDSNPIVGSGTSDSAFLVAYDFTGTVEAGRTFRATFEANTTANLDWTGMTSALSHGASLSGGDQFTNLNTMVTTYTGLGVPYRSAVVTIAGDTPIAPTLFVSDQGFGFVNKNIAAGATNEAALPLRFWTDSGHTIVLDQIAVFDSGSGVASSHVSTARLFYDVDADGAFGAADVQVASTTFTNDLATFSNLNLTIRTPTGVATDPSAVQLLVTYTFRDNVPVTNPPLTFQPIISSGVSIRAHESVVGNSAVVNLTDSQITMPDSIVGNFFRVVNGTQSSLFVETTTVPTNTTVSNNGTVVVWRGTVYADSGHRIVLTGLRMTASGSLDDKNDLALVRLIKDRDSTASFTQGDIVLFQQASFARDNDSMVMTMNEIIQTPTGTKTDSGALKLIVEYKLNGTAPFVQSNPIKFSLALLTTNDITAAVSTGESVTFVTGPPVLGDTVTVDTAPVGGAGTGGFPVISAAVITDVDTSGTINGGDFLTLAFDTNLRATSTLGASNLDLPILGDGLGGAGLSFSFLNGNKIRITLGTNVKLTLDTIYVAGQHYESAPSGITLKDTVNTILSTYDSPARAGNFIDITGTLGVPGSATGSAGPQIDSTNLPPRFLDMDTSGTVSAGDRILVSFDTNLGTCAPSASDFEFPVLGDNIGVAATFSFLGGNKLQITLGTTPQLTINGTFAAATLTESSASGINLSSNSVSTIRSIYGNNARRLNTATDIVGTTIGPTAAAALSAGAAAAAAAPPGDKVCVISRTVEPGPVFASLRWMRDALMESWLGRLMVGLYYMM